MIIKELDRQALSDMALRCPKCGARLYPVYKENDLYECLDCGKAYPLDEIP